MAEQAGKSGEAFRIEGTVSIDSARALKTLEALDGVAEKTAKALHALFTGVVSQGPRAIEGGLAQPAEKAAKKTGSLEAVLREVASKLSTFEREVQQTRTALFSLETATRKTEQAVAKSTREWVQAEAGLKKFEAAASGSKSVIALLTDGMGGFLATAALTAPWATSIKLATDFDSAMRKVDTIAKMSEEDFRKTSNSVLDLGNSLEIALDPADAAGGLYQILSANITNVADAQKVLASSALAASAGFTSVETAADLLTSVINSYGMSADEASKATDIMFQAVQIGKIEFPQMAQGMGALLGVAKSLGVTFEELNAVIAAATVKGIPAERVFSALRAVLSHLLSPSAGVGQDAVDQFAKMGVQVDKAAVQSRGLIAVLKDMRTAAGDNDTIIRELVEDVDAFNLVLTLTNDGGKLLDSTLLGIADSAGAARDSADRVGKGFQNVLNIFLTDVKALGIEVGREILPALSELAKRATDLIRAFRGAGETTRNAVVTIAGIGTVTLLTVPRIVSLVKVLGELRVAQTAATVATGAGVAFEGMGAAAATAVGGLSRLSFILGTGGVYGAVASLIAIPVAIAIDMWSQHLEEVDKRFNSAANSARDFGKSIREIPPPPQELVDPSGRLGDWSKITEGSKEAAELTRRWTEELDRAAKALEKEKDPIAKIDAALQAAAAQYQTIADASKDAPPDLFPNAEKNLRELRNIIQFYTDLKNKMLSGKTSGPEVPKGSNSNSNKADLERLATEKRSAREAIKAWEDFKRKREAGAFETKDAELKAHDEALAGLRKYAEAGKSIGKAFNEALQDATWSRVRLVNTVEQEQTREHQKQVANRLKDSLDAIDAELKAGKISYEVALQRLKDLRDANKEVLGQSGMEDERRTVETKISSTEEAGKKDRVEKAKRAAEAEAKAAEAAAQTKDAEIELAKARGASSTEVLGLLRQRAELQERVVQKTLDGNLKEARSRKATTAEIKALEEEAAQKVLQIRLDLAKDIEDLDNEELDRKKKISDLQGQLREAEADDIDRQVQRLETGVQNGTVSAQTFVSQAEGLLRKRLNLKLQTLREEARLELESAKAAGASAEEQALMRQVQAKKEVNAIRDAEDEISKIRQKASDEQKKNQDDSKKSSLGSMMTLEEAMASQSSSMGIESSREKIRQQQAASSSGPSTTSTAISDSEARSNAVGMLQAEKSRMEQSLQERKDRNAKGGPTEDTSRLEQAIQMIVDKIATLEKTSPGGTSAGTTPVGPGSEITTITSPPGPGTVSPTTPGSTTTVSGGTKTNSGAGATPGKTEVQVNVKIDVDGQLKVSKGPLSDGTTKGLIADLRLMDYAQGDFSGSLGRTT